MKDKGINRGLVQDFNTSDRRGKGSMWGWRKMFWDYLNKLHVGFYDPCCAEAGDEDITGLRFNNATGESEFWDPVTEAWVPTGDWAAPTTTSSTTTTTTTP